jgi:hypothetical protein
VSISIRRNKRDEKGGDRSLTRATARVSCHGLAKSVNTNTALKLSQQPHTGWMVDGWMDGPGYFFFLLTPPIPFLLSSPPPPERQRFPAHAKTFRRIDRAHRNCNQTESRAEQSRAEEGVEREKEVDPPPPSLPAGTDTRQSLGDCQQTDQ